MIANFFSKCDTKIFISNLGEVQIETIETQPVQMVDRNRRAVIVAVMMSKS